MLKRIVPSADIDDIVQEKFIRAHEAEIKKRIDHPKAYIYKTARNLALNFIARKENTLTSKLEDYSEPDVYLQGLGRINELESKEKFRLFCAAVRDLPPQCRRAFILKRVFFSR
ncbi:MAG: RNA polymerase sigma-70 factor (ECF subfamily) [Arenicella sp.]|jgi:RNA polymerase sigma-70 factor (ECF subfamily)